MESRRKSLKDKQLLFKGRSSRFGWHYWLIKETINGQMKLTNYVNVNQSKLHPKPRQQSYFFKRTTKNDQNEGVLPPKSDKNKEDLGFDLQTLWGVNISTSKQTPVLRKAYEHEMSYWQKNVL